MIRSLFFNKNGEIHTELELDEFSQLLGQPDGLLWVDFEATPPQQDEPILREIFNFHPLAIDDALQESHVPKLDDWEKYLYIVLHAVAYAQSDPNRITTQELDFFLGDNYVVTHHDQPISALDRVWASTQKDERFLRNGADHLFYRLADEVITSYMPIVEMLDDEIDQLEDMIFDHPTPEMLENIFQLKRSVLRLRRVIGPQREVMNKLARDNFAVIDARDRIYFRDVYDHLVRLQDFTENIRDLISGTLDTYLSVINNRMNEIMKTLTVITTMFMPISFVASFFGMNFFAASQPLASWVAHPVFTLVAILTVLTPFGMFLWMRQRGWM